jgi:hypothetical protein
MLGVAHHSPWVISVFLDRTHFHEHIITAAHLDDGTWRDRFERYAAAEHDGRVHVIFIETFRVFCAVLRVFGADVFANQRVVLYDDETVLSHLPITVIDAVEQPDGSWAMHRLSLDETNDQLATADVGVPDGVEKIRIPDVMIEMADPGEPNAPDETDETDDQLLRALDLLNADVEVSDEPPTTEPDVEEVSEDEPAEPTPVVPPDGRDTEPTKTPSAGKKKSKSKSKPVASFELF